MHDKEYNLGYFVTYKSLKTLTEKSILVKKSYNLD